MEIRKLRSQLPIVLERVSAHLQGAWSTLARLGRGAFEKLQEGYCAEKNVLHKLQRSIHDAVVVTNGKIEKFRSRLYIVLEWAAAHLQGAWSTLARLRRGASEKVQKGYCAGKNVLHKLQRSIHDAVVVTNGKIEKFRSRLSIVLEWAAAHLQGAWSTLARLGRGASEKLQEGYCAGKNVVYKLQGSIHDAVVVTDGKIEKFRSRLSIVLRQVTVHVQRVLSGPVILGRRVVDTPQRLREARLARQNDLRTLVATSSDPVIVTNSNRRLVAANSHGLDLFGVSELNMSQFTMGTFLSDGQILQFDRNRPSSKGPEETYAECKIRRLDGTSWVAECIFVANIVPHQNLYRFQHVTRQKTAQMGSPASYTKHARNAFGRTLPESQKQVDDRGIHSHNW